MNTFKQVIDLFIEGATGAIEGSIDKPHAKLIIFSNSLLWVPEDMIYIVAIRLSDKLFVKNTTWHNRPPMSEFRYIDRKCKGKKIHLEKIAFETIPENHHPDFNQDRYIQNIERAAAEQIGRDLMIAPPSSELSIPQRAYRKEYSTIKTSKSYLSTIRATEAIYIYLEKHGTGKIDKPTLNDMIFNIERTRRALLRIDSYLQVCMTLPEISSPGIIEQDEHPGGIDSCSSPLSE